jgi:uncharacterized protein (DUF1501 family)
MSRISTERRDFIKLLLSAGPQTSVGLASLAAMGNIAAQTSTDTRFLVCLYMRGGNDQSNFLVPTTSSVYNTYASARVGITLPTTSVLPLTPNAYSGPALGMHPSLPFLRTLFNNGSAALIANVGNLVGPITKAQWNAGNAQTAVPTQLFSHNDQESQWGSLSPLVPGKTGWLGRTADLITDTFNTASPVSMNISLGRQSFVLGGSRVLPYQVTQAGGTALYAPQSNNAAITALRSLYSQSSTNLLERQVNNVFNRSIAAYTSLSTAMSGTSVSNVFPDTALGKQLNGVAKVMGAAANLGQRRMVFYVDIEGFDFHDDILTRQANRLTEVNDAIQAFHTYLTNSGNLAKTVVFSASDFGRALQTNGKGSDHGWGSHHFAFGGPVAGKKIYGQFPTVALGGPEDSGQGRLIPTTSFDQYAATLATWFGVSNTNLSLVAPNIGNFNNQNLGFLSA